MLIWWARGHGYGNPNPGNPDNYSAGVQYTGFDWYFTENVYSGSNTTYRIIYNTLNFENYKRKKIIWATCHSGHLLQGNLTLLNGGNPANRDDKKSIVLTSVAFDELGASKEINNEWHAGYPFAIYCTLMGHDPWSNPINFDPDLNGDGVISMSELHQAVKYNTHSCFDEVSWSDAPPDMSGIIQRKYPQIGDPCIGIGIPVGDYTYMEENLKLKGHTLSLLSGSGENKRYYYVDNVTAGNDDQGIPLIIPNNSNINFVVDSYVKLKPGFHAKSGCRFHAYIGEIECP